MNRDFVTHAGEEGPHLCLWQTHDGYQTQFGCSLNQTWTMNAKMPPKKSIPITPKSIATKVQTGPHCSLRLPASRESFST